MGHFTILQMFENPRRGRQARNFTTNAPKILDLKSSSEQIFSGKIPVGCPCLLENFGLVSDIRTLYALSISSESVFDNIGTGFFSLKILQESEVSED